MQFGLHALACSGVLYSSGKSLSMQCEHDMHAVEGAVLCLPYRGVAQVHVLVYCQGL